MRAKLLGAVLAALLAPVAYAGDITKPGKIIASPVISAAAQDNTWNRTGMYVGLLGAYDTTVLETEGIDLASGKLMAGAMVGWNFRVAPAFVLGIEADWIFTGISTSKTDDEVFLKATTDHLISLRARAGIPIGPALLFVTAGPAWQHAKLTVGDTSDREWQLGAAFGGGAEVELSRAFAIRLEALHYVFPDDQAPLSDLLKSENQHTTIRAGAIFKLN
jgi:outer membrane immunogenic protein